MSIFKLRNSILALMSLVASAISAAIPAGYYTPLNGKSESELKTAIHNLVYNHTLVSSYNNLPQYFQTTDVYPDGSKRWWDMYSDIPLYAPLFSGLNREHSLPKSWWGGSTSTPAYTDLNHLYPSEAKANMAKSNYPLGIVSGTPTFDNGIAKVGYPVTGQGGGAEKVFEPSPQYRGDFARTYFYMVCCYQNLHWKYTYMMDNNIYPTLTPWAINLLMEWHRNDPVSQKEIDRNEQVYKYQNNRNPFIDYPDLAEYLWGNKKGLVFNESTAVVPGGEPTLITPVQGMELDFGQCVVGKSVTRYLLFRGENLRGSLSLVLSRNDKAMFSLESSSLSTSRVNTASGYEFKVTYTPTSEGTHTTRLIVSDGGISGSLGVGFRGEGCPEPVLTAPVALPASDITDNTYRANWEIPEGEVIDYYVVTRTRIKNGTSSTETMVAEENYLDIDDFAESTSEMYTVQSCRLDVLSPVSNSIMVTHAGVEGVEVIEGLGTAYHPGGVRFVCGDSHTNGRVIDMSGREIMQLPVIENDMTIELPLGVYIILTDQQRIPLKVYVR